MTDYKDQKQEFDERSHAYADRGFTTAALQDINGLEGTSFVLGERLAGAGRNAGVWTIRDADRSAILKWVPRETDAGHQERAAKTCAVLAEQGAPVPKYYGTGVIDGGVYALMSLMTGKPPGPEHFTESQMGDLLRIVELQAGRAIEPSDWPDKLIDRIFKSDTNYTFPELMDSWSSDAKRLLERCRAIADRSRNLKITNDDIVHQDMNPSNIFVEEDHISAIVDWENTTSGDRAWDITEILFCCWERPALRGLVLKQLQTVSTSETATLFAADMSVAFSSGAMAQGSSDWANRCVWVGNQLLDVVSAKGYPWMK